MSPLPTTYNIVRMLDAELIAARSILLTWFGRSRSNLSLSSTKLFGGTEAAGVYRVVASYEGDGGRPRQCRLIVKHLAGHARREAVILQQLEARPDCRLLPKLMGTFQDHNDDVYVGLKEVRRLAAWPWKNNEMTTKFMRELGEFHAVDRRDVHEAENWDYEGELLARAEETGTRLRYASRNPDMAALAPCIRPMERLTAELPRLRSLLLREAPFGARLIHGDVHPGNALVRSGATPQPVLIDWGRARIGSPLEDVSSMLQSLRFYEPATLQGHDTLLKDYLTGTGGERRISDSIRSAYWLAGASNALAGALGWHLLIATDETHSRLRRQAAFSAAKDWLRVIRRALAWTL